MILNLSNDPLSYVSAEEEFVLTCKVTLIQLFLLNVFVEDGYVSNFFHGISFAKLKISTILLIGFSRSVTLIGIL